MHVMESLLWPPVQRQERTILMCKVTASLGVFLVFNRHRTGEVAWVRDMIGKYHETAKANGSIVRIMECFLESMEAYVWQMIPQIGIESAPADLATWSLASFIRQKLSVGVREVIFTMQA